MDKGRDQGFSNVIADVTLSHLLGLANDSKKNKRSFDAIQDHLPGRFRGFLLANAPWWIRIPLRIMSVFMKAKLRDKFVLADNATIAQRLGGADRCPPTLQGYGFVSGSLSGWF